ncbi:hypothetical protein GW17_00023272 [Ensete ventricosum]|nr:hypothetical protein GW17_00023272 [Ensete ventricosum]
MVRDSRRVINEHSQIIDGLRVKVQMLKEETGLVAVATVEARAGEASRQVEEVKSQLRESQHRETKAWGLIQVLEVKLLDLTIDLDVARIKAYATEQTLVMYEYLVALAHFWVSHSKLKIKEDPYATLPEDDDVPMEVEVPFDDINPLAT